MSLVVAIVAAHMTVVAVIMVVHCTLGTSLNEFTQSLDMVSLHE